MAFDAFDYLSECETIYVIYEAALIQVGDPAFQHIPYNRQFDCLLAFSAFEVCLPELYVGRGGNRSMGDVVGPSPPSNYELACALEIMAGTSDRYDRDDIRPTLGDEMEALYWSVP